MLRVTRQWRVCHDESADEVRPRQAADDLVHDGAYQYAGADVLDFHADESIGTSEKSQPRSRGCATTTWPVTRGPGPRRPKNTYHLMTRRYR